MEDAQNCYNGLDGAEHAAEFMTITCECTEAMKASSPAVVHVDGTARPQLVRRETHPLIHEILSAYRRRTGIPSLINTSFNVHEEPIVCSPSDAIRGFLETGIDLLYLEGGFLVSFEENLPAAMECMRHALAQPSQKEQQLASEIIVLSQRQARLSAELELEDLRLKGQAARIVELERVAEERLSSLHTVHQETEALRGEADARERGLHELTAVIAARDARIIELERVAEERLSSLNTVHQHLEALRGESGARERGLHELTAVIAARDACIAELERVAEERLSNVNTIHQNMVVLRSESDLRERGLHELASLITARDARIAELERMGEERLSKLNAVHQHMEAIRGESDARERGLHELTSVIATRDARIAELERAVEEQFSRLNSMQTQLEAVRSEADARETALHERTSVIAARDARIAELERVAQDRLTAVSQVQTKLTEAIALQEVLSTQVLALEHETLVKYLTRRIRKLRVG
jgi:chromosome segregation ATPase